MSDDNGTTGEIADCVTSSLGSMTKIITGTSEAAGAAEEVASVEKFKMHKDDPHQVP